MLFSEPQVGIEPTTYSLRENRSATELLRLVMFVEAVGVEPTKAEWQQIYSLPSLTAGAHLNFFCFLVETIGVEPISTDFQSVA